MTAVPRCAGCRHRLKHPSPIGYGPVCERRLGLTINPPPARPTSEAPPHCDGQTELPLEDP